MWYKIKTVLVQNKQYNIRFLNITRLLAYRCACEYGRYVNFIYWWFQSSSNVNQLFGKLSFQKSWPIKRSAACEDIKCLQSNKIDILGISCCCLITFFAIILITRLSCANCMCWLATFHVISLFWKPIWFSFLEQCRKLWNQRN